MTGAQMFLLMTAIYVAPNIGMVGRTLMGLACLAISVYLQFFA